MTTKPTSLADFFDRNDRTGCDYTKIPDAKRALQAVRVAECIQLEVQGADDVFLVCCTKAQAKGLIKDATAADGVLGVGVMAMLDGTLVIGGH